MIVSQLAALKNRVPLLRGVHFGQHVPLSVRWAAKRFLYRGDARYCNICNSSVSHFLDAGYRIPRPDGACPVCHSWERHRLSWYFLEHQTTLFSMAKSGQNRPIFLHIAPGPHLRQRLSAVKHLRYLTADLQNQDVDVNFDLTQTPLPQASIDAMYCSHVLEHIPDDIAVMKEMFRVLKPGGWCVIMVPLHEGDTVEDPTLTDPEERIRRFGQEDHVRIYGRDIVRRLQSCDFEVKEIVAQDLMGDSEIERLRIAGERLFWCIKS